MGSAAVSHRHVDSLLLLYLERSEVDRKGSYHSPEPDLLSLKCVDGGTIEPLFRSQVVYFSATFPYAMLLILLVRGLSLPGALQGVQFYVMPDIKRIADAQVLPVANRVSPKVSCSGRLTRALSPQVWMEAAGQIFFSYSVGVGSLIVLGSYNPYKNNCYKSVLTSDKHQSRAENQHRHKDSTQIKPPVFAGTVCCCVY